MTTYTGESLQNVNKKDLIPIYLLLQNKPEDVNSSVAVDIHKMNESFSKLEAGLFVIKWVNSLLSSSSRQAF